jgi:hypothetical protein
VHNPNAFFYRNRPPGDPQKCGGFSQEEYAQFLERVEYFRKLGLLGGHWGLFAVPIRGRVGYQCGSYYHVLLSEGRIPPEEDSQIGSDGKVIRPPRLIDPATIQALETEAFEFIASCLGCEEGDLPKVLAPIVESSAAREREERLERRDRPRQGQIRAPVDKDLSLVVGRRRPLPEHDFPDRDNERVESRERRRRERVEVYEGDRCPLCGAIDPLTGQPIERPMIDPSGLVMDLESWRKVFREEEVPPWDIIAKREQELIEVTADNFDRYKLHVLNIGC